MKKTCSRCGAIKEEEEFYVGGSPWCKDCHRQYMTNRKQLLKTSKKLYLNPHKAKPLRSRYMTSDEWIKFRACIDKPTFLLLWDLILDGGLRIREALPLRKEDFDCGRCSANIKVLKKKSEHIVDISVAPELCEQIKKLPAGKLFKFSYNYALQEFKRTAAKAKLDIRYSPHSLRHLAGSAAYDATRDIVAVQETLRHTSIASSRLYIHISSKSRREIMDKVRNERKSW